MSYRAIASFWDGAKLYQAGDAVSLSEQLAGALLRSGKIKVEPDVTPPIPAIEQESPKAEAAHRRGRSARRSDYHPESEQ